LILQLVRNDIKIGPARVHGHRPIDHKYKIIDRKYTIASALVQGLK